MSHDKIKAAARRRMAETGESYAAARREVIKEFQAAGHDAPAGRTRNGSRSATTAWDRSPAGPTRGWAGARRADGSRSTRANSGCGWPTSRSTFRVPPFAAVARSSFQAKGTIGVHSKGDTWLANGSAHGLVEITIDPPVYTPRSLSSLFLRRKVSALIVSLVDPDGFIAAVER